MNGGTRRERELVWIAANPEEYRIRNRDKMRKRRVRNAEKVREQKNRYSALRMVRDPDGYAAMLARHAAAMKKRRVENSAAVRARDRAKYVRSCRDHPEVRQAQRQRRIARQKMAPGRGVTAMQWAAIRDGAAGLCAYCHQPAKLTIDHIDPLSRGGAHDVDNIAGACDYCNKSKNDSPLLVWLARRAA